MAEDHDILKKKLSTLEKLLEESKEEARYYQRIAEDSGKRRLREIDQLSDLIAERKKSEETVLNAKEEWERTFDAVPDLIAILNDKFRIIRVNKAMSDIMGLSPDESVGLLCYEHVHGVNKPPDYCPHAKLLEDGRAHSVEVHEKKLGGDYFVSVSPLYDVKGSLIGSVHVAHNITERKKSEEMLRKAHEELENKVVERTRELSVINEKLIKEIEERNQTEKTLRETEKDLKRQTKHLEEVNTALKVLIEHRDEENRKLEENVLENVRKLVFPYVERLENIAVKSQMKSYLSIIRTNLEDIISPFSNILSSKHLSLTPAEIKIADMVRNGLTNKEIAYDLNVSTDAVSFHRKNIRKKLGLTKKKTNLRSYLLRVSDKDR